MSSYNFTPAASIYPNNFYLQQLLPSNTQQQQQQQQHQVMTSDDPMLPLTAMLLPMATDGQHPPTNHPIKNNSNNNNIPSNNFNGTHLSHHQQGNHIGGGHNVVTTTVIIDGETTKLCIPDHHIRPTEALHRVTPTPTVCRLHHRTSCHQGSRCRQAHVDQHFLTTVRNYLSKSPPCCLMHTVFMFSPQQPQQNNSCGILAPVVLVDQTIVPAHVIAVQVQLADGTFLGATIPMAHVLPTDGLAKLAKGTEHQQNNSNNSGDAVVVVPVSLLCRSHHHSLDATLMERSIGGFGSSSHHSHRRGGGQHHSASAYPAHATSSAATDTPRCCSFGPDCRYVHVCHEELHTRLTGCAPPPQQQHRLTPNHYQPPPPPQHIVGISSNASFISHHHHHHHMRATAAATVVESAAINKNEMVLGIELLDCDNDDDDDDDLGAPVTAATVLAAQPYPQQQQQQQLQRNAMPTQQKMNTEVHRQPASQRSVQRVLASSLPQEVHSSCSLNMNMKSFLSGSCKAAGGGAQHHHQQQHFEVPSSSAFVKGNTSSNRHQRRACDDEQLPINTTDNHNLLHLSTTTTGSSSMVEAANSSTCSNLFSNSLRQELQNNNSNDTSSSSGSGVMMSKVGGGKRVFSSSLPSFPKTLLRFDSPTHQHNGVTPVNDRSATTAAAMTSAAITTASTRAKSAASGSANLFGLPKRNSQSQLSENHAAALHQQHLVLLQQSQRGSNGGTPVMKDGQQLRKSHNPYRGVQSAPATYLIC